MLWNSFCFGLGSLLVVSSILNRSDHAGVVTALSSSPKSVIASEMYPLMSFSMMPRSLWKVRAIPRKLCLSPLVTFILPNLFSNIFITSVTMSLLMCDILLSSMCHTMVYCFLLIVALATHKSYGFSLNPSFIRVLEYSSYQSRVDYTHPHRALFSLKYNTFLPFSSVIYFW